MEGPPAPGQNRFPEDPPGLLCFGQPSNFPAASGPSDRRPSFTYLNGLT